MYETVTTMTTAHSSQAEPESSSSIWGGTTLIVARHPAEGLVCMLVDCPRLSRVRGVGGAL